MTGIVVEPPRSLAAQGEFALLRAALAKRPDQPQLRLRLARLLNEGDAFAETVELLEGAATTAPEFIVLGEALFAIGANERAGAAAERAAACAADTPTRARALAEQAKALLRAGAGAEAAALLEQALELHPASVAAFKRLAIYHLRAGEPEAALALRERIAGQGVGHARLHAARAMALAMLGRGDEARAVVDLPARLYAKDLPPPEGWPDAAAFNAALEAELLANPAIRFERHGTASKKSWRIDSPATGEAPAVQALLGRIAEAAAAHATTLPDAPERAELRSWCVITEGEGREQWHMHPYGWLSGGYYVAVPEAVAAGEGGAGCLGFGLPDGLIGAAAAAAFGETMVRPRTGLLTLFPSHAYHRTWPHNAQGKRICLAFDICPV